MDFANACAGSGPPVHRRRREYLSNSTLATRDEIANDVFAAPHPKQFHFRAGRGERLKSAFGKRRRPNAIEVDDAATMVFPI